MDLSKRKVAQYMEKRITKIRHDTSVAQALQMIDIDSNQLGVVVDSGNTLKGVIGSSDVTQTPDFAENITKELKDTNLFTKSPDVATCAPDDSLQKALDLMDSKNVKSCVVVENDRPVGVITRRGLRKKLLSEFRIRL